MAEPKGPLESLGWAFRVLGTALSAKFMLSSLKTMEQREQRQKQQRNRDRLQRRPAKRKAPVRSSQSIQEPPEVLSYEDIV